MPCAKSPAKWVRAPGSEKRKLVESIRMDGTRLRGMSLGELEAVYGDAATGPAPSGRFRGKWLTWIDSAGARQIDVRMLDTLMFRMVTFGIDFDRSVWWFARPSLRAGR